MAVPVASGNAVDPAEVVGVGIAVERLHRQQHRTMVIGDCVESIEIALPRLSRLVDRILELPLVRRRDSDRHMRRCRPDGVIQDRTQVVNPLARRDRELLRQRHVLVDTQNVYAVALPDERSRVRMVCDVRVPDLDHPIRDLAGSTVASPCMCEEIVGDHRQSSLLRDGIARRASAASQRAGGGRSSQGSYGIGSCLMRVIAWTAGTIARLLMIVGALCLLAIAAAAIGYLFGERSFPAPFSQTGTGLGVYTLQVGAMVVGAWLLWRLRLSVVLRTGQPRDVFWTFGRDDERDQWEEREGRRCNPSG